MELLVKPQGRSTSVGSSASARDGSKAIGAPIVDETSAPWTKLYCLKPGNGEKSLFELEKMVAKRMELLAWIDTLVNSPKSQNMADLLDKIRKKIQSEKKATRAKSKRESSTSAQVRLGETGDDDEEGGAVAVSQRTKVNLGFANDGEVEFEEGEDLLSHLLCRFAFCTADKWKRWFVRMEELLFRARLIEGGNDIGMILRANAIDCQPLSLQDNTDKFKKFIAYKNISRSGANAAADRFDHSFHDYFSAPITLASKLVKDRAVLCHNGRALVSKNEALEVLLSSFRDRLFRGLHECSLLRSKVSPMDESELAHVSVMLDAFLNKFVIEPSDRSTVAAEGSIRASDVQLLANTSFPLCMRRVDRHMRQEGHLKHTGRLTYGLFLKQIGLSKDDAMQLFSTLMTIKGGGSIEAFSKSAYGYGIRHNYGLEGKKTSYTSMSCAKIIAQPPNVDRHDCHGCPFRFRDELTFRGLLGQEYSSPYVADGPRQRLMPSEIEDIVKDAKEMHYTRACFRYFVATHPQAKRETLFRSPAEYFETSREAKKQYEQAEGRVSSGVAGESSPTTNRFTGSTKRSLIAGADTADGATKPRLEE